MNIVDAHEVATEQKRRSLFRHGWQVFALSFALILIGHVNGAGLSVQALKVELPAEVTKAVPENIGTKELPGRLVTFKDGSIVFRAQGLETDIPVTGTNGNPFRENANDVFAKDQNARELVGTVPVSVRIPNGENRSVEVRSNVGQVWSQISLGFKNKTLANKLQRSVTQYEANAGNILSTSSNGWVGTITLKTATEIVKGKPEKLAEFQKSIATNIFEHINSPSASLTRDDFARSAELFQASDPDQLFGSYGPISINWSLDQLRSFVRAAASVASISYFTDVKGSGFLIGDGLILTCEHVLDHLDLNSATATFQPVDDAHSPVTASFEVQPVLRSSQLNLTSKISNRKLQCDFALLKLKDAKPLADAGIRPLTICKDNMLNAVVAVVGYPEPNKLLTIHDNGTMLFPYVLPRRDFETVYMQRVVHSLNAGTAPTATSDAAFQARLRNAQATFRDAYGYHENDAPNTNYFYVGHQDDWKDVPSFGVDASTNHGDSGGAVFDKGTLKVIGILRGGRDGSYAAGSWFNHDKVIPISEVIDSIAQADPNLFTTYKVNVSK